MELKIISLYLRCTAGNAKSASLWFAVCFSQNHCSASLAYFSSTRQREPIECQFKSYSVWWRIWVSASKAGIRFFGILRDILGCVSGAPAKYAEGTRMIFPVLAHEDRDTASQLKWTKVERTNPATTYCAPLRLRHQTHYAPITIDSFFSSFKLTKILPCVINNI